jgi:hypothetical protein
LALFATQGGTVLTPVVVKHGGSPEKLSPLISKFIHSVLSSLLIMI